VRCGEQFSFLISHFWGLLVLMGMLLWLRYSFFSYGIFFFFFFFILSGNAQCSRPLILFERVRFPEMRKCVHSPDSISSL
jgi:hypothetical protein